MFHVSVIAPNAMFVYELLLGDMQSVGEQEVTETVALWERGRGDG